MCDDERIIAIGVIARRVVEHDALAGARNEVDQPLRSSGRACEGDRCDRPSLAVAGRFRPDNELEPVRSRRRARVAPALITEALITSPTTSSTRILPEMADAARVIAATSTIPASSPKSDAVLGAAANACGWRRTSHSTQAPDPQCR